MLILSLHVENFGRLHDLDIDFKTGLNEINESNGWGKSTLSEFIRAMFYGISERSERKKYQPWQGGNYGGSLTFSNDVGVYTVVRLFGNKASEDSFTLYNATTNLQCFDYSERLGEELFSLGTESFMRTMYIRQSDSNLTTANDEINAKLGNITDRVDLNCYAHADDYLKKEENRLSKTRKTGEVWKLNDRALSLKKELNVHKNIEEDISRIEHEIVYRQGELKACHDEQIEIDKMRNSILQNDRKMLNIRTKQELINELNAKEELYNRARHNFFDRIPSPLTIDSWKQSYNRLAEGAIRNGRLTVMLEDRDKELSQCENDYQLVKKRIRNSKRVKLAVSAFFILLSILLYLFILVPQNVTVHKLILSFITIIPGIVLFCMCFIPPKKLRVECERLRATRMRLKDSIDTILQGIEDENRALEDINHNLTASMLSCGIIREEDLKNQLKQIEKDIKEVENAKTLYEDVKRRFTDFSNSHEDNEQDVVSDKVPSTEEIDKKQELLAIKRDNLTDSLMMYRDNLKDAMAIYEEVQNNRIELRKVMAEYDRLETKLTVITRTRELLSQARENMISKYMGPLLDGFNKYFAMFTGEGYKAFSIDANMVIQKEEYGIRRSLDSYSNGYRDIFGFAERMAMVDAMFKKEKPMLILDDPFINLDNDKLNGGLKMLEKIAEEYQILYFTCSHERSSKNI